MKLLDLAKFVKVGEDKNTTRMRHEDGHEMTIMMAALPKIHREQLRRLKMADGGIARYPDGGKVEAEPVDPSDPENQAPPTEDHGTTTNIATPNQPQSSPAPASIQGAANISPQAQASPLQQQAQGILNAQAQQATGANQQAQVDIAKANAMLPVEKAFVAAEANRAQRLRDNANLVQGATGDYDTYIAQHGIDPQHFAQSLPVAQKVTTALGLLIGGFGGGFSGTGNNPALNWLKDQQNKDIEAQQNNITNQKTVLGAYQQLFNNNAAAIEATRISDNNKLAHQAAQIAAQQGTPQAWANYNAFVGKLKLDNDQHTQQAAGYLTTNPPAGASPVSPAGSSQATPQGSASSNGILAPDAEKKYQQVLYDPTKTPQQKAELQDEYLKGVQIDKAIQQIDALYPEIADKATWGGYLANKVNPHIVGGIAGLGTEAALTAGTGGAGLLAAVPAAAAAGAVGEAAGYGIKQGLTGLGGQQQTQYETARASLIGYIGSALQGVQITPSEIGELADQFMPTKIDSAATIKDKHDKLIEKIKTLAKTGALHSAGMTRD